MRQQYLEERSLAGLPELTGDLCCVQAQVLSAAELGLAARRAEQSPGRLDHALWSERTLMRTWLMRGTLHVAAAAELMRYSAVLGSFRTWERPSWLKYFELTLMEFHQLCDAIDRALGDGEALTRQELSEAIIARLKRRDLAEKLASGWGSLLKPAAFMGRLCQGPPRTRNVTYVRPDLWGAVGEGVAVEEAGPWLVERFLALHGPSSIANFARWLGYTPPGQVRGWFEALGETIAPVDVDGTHMYARRGDLEGLEKSVASGSVRLLPHFDQFILAAERGIEYMLPDKHRTKVFRKGAWISPLVIKDGRIVGIWAHKNGTLTVTPFERVTKKELRSEIDHLEPYLYPGRPIALVLEPVVR